MRNMDKLIKRLPTDLIDMIFSFYTGWHPYYEHCIDQIKNINNTLCIYRETSILMSERRRWCKMPIYKFILLKNKQKKYLNDGKNTDKVDWDLRYGELVPNYGYL